MTGKDNSEDRHYIAYMGIMAIILTDIFWVSQKLDVNKYLSK